MAKDPTFPFYAQDWLVDTIRWTRAMQGLHICLLAESWANGGLHDDGGHPAGLDQTDVEQWFKIKHKWRIVDKMWINDKLEETRAARNVFREKQREKGILSGKSRTKPPTKHEPKRNSGSTVVEPLESESENEYEGIKYNKEPISKIQIFEQIFGDERFLTDLSIAHKGKNIQSAWEECWTHHSQGPSPPTEVWQWKQKLNSWLTIKGNDKQQPTGKTKRESAAESVAKAFAERVKRERESGQL